MYIQLPLEAPEGYSLVDFVKGCGGGNSVDGLNVQRPSVVGGSFGIKDVDIDFVGLSALRFVSTLGNTAEEAGLNLTGFGERERSDWGGGDCDRCIVDAGRTGGGGAALFESDNGLFGGGGGVFLFAGGGGAAPLEFREGKGGAEEVVLDVCVRFGICGGTALVFVREGNGGTLGVVRFGRGGGGVSEFIVFPMLFGIVFLNGYWGASTFDCGIGTAADVRFPSLGALGRKGGGVARSK
jgi:hypothetical protein